MGRAPFEQPPVEELGDGMTPPIEEASRQVAPVAPDHLGHARQGGLAGQVVGGHQEDMGHQRHEFQVEGVAPPGAGIDDRSRARCGGGIRAAGAWGCRGRSAGSAARPAKPVEPVALVAHQVVLRREARGARGDEVRLAAAGLAMGEGEDHGGEVGASRSASRSQRRLVPAPRCTGEASSTVRVAAPVS